MFITGKDATNYYYMIPCWLKKLYTKVQMDIEQMLAGVTSERPITGDFTFFVLF